MAAATLLSSINPANITETKSKATYSIYLNWLQNHCNGITSQDSTTLYGFAYQKPMIAGEYVYIARNILGLYLNDDLNNSVISSQTSARKSNHSNTMTEGISIYPNPANIRLFIEILGDYSNRLDYTIFSIDGRIVKQGLISNNLLNSINTSRLMNGVYFIKIQDNTQNIYSNRFIVNK